jgi:hypothetical protein
LGPTDTRARGLSANVILLKGGRDRSCRRPWHGAKRRSRRPSLPRSACPVPTRDVQATRPARCRAGSYTGEEGSLLGEYESVSTYQGHCARRSAGVGADPDDVRAGVNLESDTGEYAHAERYRTSHFGLFILDFPNKKLSRF